MKLQVLHATIKNTKISDAEVIAQRQGETSVKGTTSQDGALNLDVKFPDDSKTTLIVKKAGFSDLVAMCPCDGMAYALSPTQKTLDGMRIVLSWGEQPKDLDSHIVSGPDHVYFSEKTAGNIALDVDDTDSFGPETITISERDPSRQYVYAVHDYSNRENNNSNSLSNLSRAKVFVYVGESLVRTYYAPQNQIGTMWMVFGVDTDGAITDINSMTSPKTDSRADVRKAITDVTKSGWFKAPPPVAVEAAGQATALNRQGETAYHAKKLDEAIRLYQEAINLNPEYAQAYSNIGLAFDKAGRSAEAIWANRKAIALASGTTANTVKASSYYNIARIYEKESKWEKAKEHFEKAQGFRARSAYTKGIKRMKEKLGAR